MINSYDILTRKQDYVYRETRRLKNLGWSKEKIDDKLFILKLQISAMQKDIIKYGCNY